MGRGSISKMVNKKTDGEEHFSSESSLLNFEHTHLPFWPTNIKLLKLKGTSKCFMFVDYGLCLWNLKYITNFLIMKNEFVYCCSIICSMCEIKNCIGHFFLFLVITTNGNWNFQDCKRDAKAPWKYHKISPYDCCAVFQVFLLNEWNSPRFYSLFPERKSLDLLNYSSWHVFERGICVWYVS